MESDLSECMSVINHTGHWMDQFLNAYSIGLLGSNHLLMKLVNDLPFYLVKYCSLAKGELCYTKEPYTY